MKLSKDYCHKLSESISNKDLMQMLGKAQRTIKDWSVPSRSNKGLSRGTNWNLFCKHFTINSSISAIIKYRMLEEFGEFLPDHLVPIKAKTQPTKRPTHQEPVFNDDFELPI